MSESDHEQASDVLGRLRVMTGHPVTVYDDANQTIVEGMWALHLRVLALEEERADGLRP